MANNGGTVYEGAGLTKHYDDGQVQALRGVDFRITEGEFVAIIGQSGSGKSTLLQMLGALDRPSGGTLTYRGKSLADMQCGWATLHLRRRGRTCLPDVRSRNRLD